MEDVAADAMNVATEALKACLALRQALDNKLKGLPEDIKQRDAYVDAVANLQREMEHVNASYANLSNLLNILSGRGGKEPEPAPLPPRGSVN
jgi:hypothetical protein